MNYWFAGFWPAEEPRYTIVVLQDGTPEPAVSCGSIFAQVCEALYWLDPEAFPEAESGKNGLSTASNGVDNGA